jgi:hypothetical protein
MKLIKQTALWNREGNADKVYEIDLCETAPDRFVVNFRYGRRGSLLKDGTKTVMPVSLDAAEKIFNALKLEKERGGYKTTDDYEAASIKDIADTKSLVNPPENKHHAIILNKLVEALKPGNAPEQLKAWPLSRIIWRVGQLQLKQAAPLLIPQLAKGNPLMQYIVCWSLGRCGDTIAIEPLQAIYQSKATAAHVKRIALAALLQLQKLNETDGLLVATLVQSLPTQVQQYLKNDELLLLKAYFNEAVTNPDTANHITTSYLVSEQYPIAAQALFEWLQQITIGPDYFKTARHIFKLAEFREDAPVFSVLAYKFETSKALFSYPSYNKNGYVFYNGKNFKHAIDEQKKPNSRLAYSFNTRQYFMRRLWRTLRTFGNDGMEAYVRMAYGILLQYNQIDDEKEPRQITNEFFKYNVATRRYERLTEIKWYSAYPNSLLLNHILYSGGQRYQLKPGNNAWRLLNQTPPEAIPQREEAFPEVWDKYPQALVQLLFDSKLEIVHQFAVKALKDRTDLHQFFNLTIIKQLLALPIQATVGFALVMIEKLYDAKNPDIELVVMLLQHPLQQARSMALAWLEKQVDYFLAIPQLPPALIINAYSDVHQAANTWLRYKPQYAQANCDVVLAQLIDLPATMQQANEASNHARVILCTHYMDYLHQTPVHILVSLMQSNLEAVQTLAADILQQHTLQPAQYPDGLLASLIQSNYAGVRSAGITLFGRLPQAQLFENAGLIASFCVSPYEEIRTSILPTVMKLANKDETFAKALLNNLLPYMQRSESAERLHQNLYELFTRALPKQTLNIDGTLVLSFIHSRHRVPPQLGLWVLQQNLALANDFSIRQWIRLANHEVWDIRNHAWLLFSTNTDRIRQEADEALRILDSSWEDTRAFGFQFFKQYFTENQWTPELLVSVCDSTKPDVQAFGRGMITEYFKEENGEYFLLQLSQHPAQQVQHFTTHYLDQFAAENPLNIEKLELYFVTVLSQVNKAGVAKKRIFNFLEQEAQKNEQVAQLVVKIMERQSATMAVADKAACIKIMHQLALQYPELEMPLKVGVLSPRPLRETLL